MGASTGISWTDSTWNPVRGCSIVSTGCKNCYAMHVAARFSGEGLPYEGLAERGAHGKPKWTGAVRMVPSALGQPLRWRRPRRIFVNSMSDLFHEGLKNEEIAAVFGVMAAAPQHTFQILTKRAERMRDWFRWVDKRAEDGLAMFPEDEAAWRVHQMLHVSARRAGAEPPPHHGGAWPLPNVHLGVSVEDQEAAISRVPQLLETPAAVRFVSAEPLLGAVDLSPYLYERRWDVTMLLGGTEDRRVPALSWVIIGGESGYGARPFKLGWGADLIEQCKVAGVPMFFKQAGSKPVASDPDSGDLVPLRLRRRSGDDLLELPEQLRVQQFPEAP